MENVFEPILDKDEKVEKIFKPHKLKMFLSSFLIGFCCWFWLIIPAIAIFCVNENDEFVASALKTILVVASVLVLFGGITLLFVALEYKNTYYAYTNKRVIIRKGIFGVDYKSLDMSMIGAVTVNVSFLDKILRKNTGSIGFGSMASPIGGQNASLFRFADILMPYETYKEIKSVIDDFKNNKPVA